MTTYTPEFEKAKKSLLSLIVDINKVCTNIASSRLKCSQREDIKRLLEEATSLLNDKDVTANALDGMCKTIIRDIPEVVRIELKNLDILSHALYRINNDPSLFDICKKERKESASEEYESIFHEKFNIAFKNIHSANEDVDFDDGDIQTRYIMWLKRQNEALTIYQDFMKACKMSPNNEKSHPIELFKGTYDSLKPFFRKRLDVYSKYATTINPESYRRGVYPVSDIIIRNGLPCFVIDTYNSGKLYLPINYDRFFTFFVHNPYDKKEEKKIIKLLENDDLNITYGLFGFPKEGDIDEKIEELRKLKKEFSGSKYFELYKDDSINSPIHMALLFKPRN